MSTFGTCIECLTMLRTECTPEIVRRTRAWGLHHRRESIRRDQVYVWVYSTMNGRKDIGNDSRTMGNAREADGGQTKLAMATLDTVAPQIDATAAQRLQKGLIRRTETTLPRVTCRSMRMCREVGGMRGNERPAWERRGGRRSECDTEQGSRACACFALVVTKP